MDSKTNQTYKEQYQVFEAELGNLEAGLDFMSDVYANDMFSSLTNKLTYKQAKTSNKLLQHKLIKCVCNFTINSSNKDSLVGL